MKHLLAKSSERPDSPRGEETLVGHTQLVMRGADTLLDRVGEASLAAAGLEASLLARFRRIARLAAFIHDLGKSSEHFQLMLRRQRTAPQLFRHEAASAWLCWPRSDSPLASWLLQGVDTKSDLIVAVLAASAHHRKFPARSICDEGAGVELRLLCGHADFAQLLRSCAAKLGLPPPPGMADIVMSGRSGQSAATDLRLNFPMDVDDLDLTPADRALLALSKAVVIDADIIGSALPRSEKGADWAVELLDLRSEGGLDRLVERRLHGRELRPFQRDVAASTAPVTLVKAGCGSGKTLAAWVWGATQHPHRQFWLCYPTTGTTTEGYRDYVQGADLHGFIEHGRSSIDVELFGLHEGLGLEDVTRDAERLRALRQWGADAITCTVDTVLGLLQNQRKGLYAWPGLCRGAMVFDEIHAFDESMFGLLLTWLQALPGLPVLLMTASLPEDRLAALREVVQRTHGRPLAEINGPDDLEQLPRYVRSVEPAESLVPQVLASGGKVLWVSNTVSRCMGVRAKGSWARDGLLYHSRYRYADRVQRHRDVISAFSRDGSALALTTQVAEMSLDLSADLLVTELAPIPALIQRLGRLNRRSTPEHPIESQPFVVLETGGSLPYEEAELKAARDWLQRLGGGKLSQADLAAAWIHAETPSPPRPVRCEWIDEAYATTPHEVRDASPGVTVLLEADAARVQRKEVDVAKVALPMNQPPKKHPIFKWPRVAYHPVVPPTAIEYDEKAGARWL